MSYCIWQRYPCVEKYVSKYYHSVCKEITTKSTQYSSDFPVFPSSYYLTVENRREILCRISSDRFRRFSRASSSPHAPCHLPIRTFCKLQLAPWLANAALQLSPRASCCSSHLPLLLSTSTLNFRMDYDVMSRYRQPRMCAVAESMGGCLRCDCDDGDPRGFLYGDDLDKMDLDSACSCRRCARVAGRAASGKRCENRG